MLWTQVSRFPWPRRLALLYLSLLYLSISISTMPHCIYTAPKKQTMQIDELFPSLVLVGSIKFKWLHNDAGFHYELCHSGKYLAVLHTVADVMEQVFLKAVCLDAHMDSQKAHRGVVFAYVVCYLTWCYLSSSDFSEFLGNDKVSLFVSSLTSTRFPLTNATTEQSHCTVYLSID